MPLLLGAYLLRVWGVMGKYYVGVDLSTTGCIAVTDGKKVIDVLKYPEPIFDTKRVKEIDKEIKEIKDEPRTKTRVKNLKAEKKAIKRRATRNYYEIYRFLENYRDEIELVILEEPIRMVSFGATSSDTLCSNHITLGVYVAILSVLDLPYRLYLPSEWHQFFNFKFVGKLTQKERREKIKEQSIMFSKQIFENMDDFLIKKGCKKEDDNIAEASILSLCWYYDDKGLIWGK